MKAQTKKEVKIITHDINIICICMHSLNMHKKQYVYSETLKDVVVVEKCERCGCCKFQKTPFAIASNKIEEMEIVRVPVMVVKNNG